MSLPHITLSQSVSQSISQLPTEDDDAIQKIVVLNWGRRGDKKKYRCSLHCISNIYVHARAFVSIHK